MKKLIIWARLLTRTSVEVLELDLAELRGPTSVGSRFRVTFMLLRDRIRHDQVDPFKLRCHLGIITLA